jgi:hypothetical protein
MTATQALEKKGVNTLLNINMDDLMSVSDLIFKSGVYGDLQSAAQAAMKVLAGNEYGFTPFQAQSMFDFIQKRTVLSSHAKATLINSAPDYKMKVLEITPTICTIEVYRKNAENEFKKLATESFSWEDAVAAGYTTGANAHSYKKTPRNMLFARCVSNIWRWHCSELEYRRPGDIKEFSTPELEGETSAPNGKQDFVEGEVIESNEVIEGEVVITDKTKETVEAESPEAEFSGPAEEAEEDQPTTDSARVDLETAVNELLAEKFAGDVGEIKKFLKGREIDLMTTPALDKMYGDLKSL